MAVISCKLKQIVVTTIVAVPKISLLELLCIASGTWYRASILEKISLFFAYSLRKKKRSRVCLPG
jgi:hypothetical protein